MISKGSMSASRSGTRGDVDVEPELALGGHLGGGGGQARGAEILQRDEQPGLEQLQPALEQLLLLERVADLDRRALVSSASPSSAEASTDAPPIPSRPVEAPNRISALPTPAAALRTSCSRGARPSAIALTRQLLLVGALEVDLAADRRHADRVAVVADAGDGALEQVAAALGVAASPKRSESSTAIGRAPIAKMSRRIPPTPVAAPWKGSTALGWLCDSTLKAHTQAAADVDRAGVLAGPHQHCGPSVGSARSSSLECL